MSLVDALLEAQTTENELRWASINLMVRRVDDTSLELQVHLGHRLFFAGVGIAVGIGAVVAFFTTALDVPFFLGMLAFAGLVLFQARRRAAMRITDGALWAGGRELEHPRFEVTKTDDEDPRGAFALFATTATGTEKLWACDKEDDARWLMDWLTRLLASLRPAGDRVQG